jgi:hypothetical protein
LFRHSMLQLLELHGRTESHSKFTIGPWHFLDLKEITEQTAVNVTVYLSGEKFIFIDICVLRVAKGHHNEFCFKMCYSDCEFKCVNVTSSKAR